MFTARLRFQAVVDQISTTLVKPLHGKGWRWTKKCEQRANEAGNCATSSASEAALVGSCHAKRLATASDIKERETKERT